MDLNKLYFDHQLLVMKAKQALSAELRRTHEAATSLVAGRISHVQRALGAACAPAWEAIADPRGIPLPHQLGYAS